MNDPLDKYPALKYHVEMYANYPMKDDALDAFALACFELGRTSQTKEQASKLTVSDVKRLAGQFYDKLHVGDDDLTTMIKRENGLNSDVVKAARAYVTAKRKPKSPDFDTANVREVWEKAKLDELFQAIDALEAEWARMKDAQ